MSDLIPVEAIANKIYVIRSHKVMLERDLAELYQVETRILTQAVRRNIKRFPDDFMFVLKEREFNLLISQSVISKTTGRGGTRKPPMVFTEQGVAMLSSVMSRDGRMQREQDAQKQLVEKRASHRGQYRHHACLCAYA